MKPKECINNNCNNIFYVDYFLLHQPLICAECQDKQYIKTIKNNLKN